MQACPNIAEADDSQNRHQTYSDGITEADCKDRARLREPLRSGVGERIGLRTGSVVRLALVLRVLCRIFFLHRTTPEARLPVITGRQLTTVEERVEKDSEGAERLPSPLRTESDQDDVTVPMTHVQRRCIVVQVFLTVQIT